MPVLLIFIIAALPRLSLLNLMEFKLDQALTIWQLAQFFHTPYLIKTGLISSLGIYNFPLFNYILLPFAAISYNPVFLTFIIALVNVISFVFLYFILKRYYSPMASFLVTVFISTSPWLISYSRHIWAQNLLMPFLVLYIYFILKQKTSFGLGLVLCLIIQLHASGLFLLAATFLGFMSIKINIINKRFIQGLLIGLIFAIPYLGASIISPVLSDKTFDLANFLRPFEIISGLFFSFKLGSAFSPPIFLSLIPLLVFIFKIPSRFLLVCFFSIPAMYFITRTPSYMHYYIISIPFIVLILCESFKKYYLFLLFPIIANVIFNIYVFKYIADTKIINADYGPVYEISEQRINNEINGVLSSDIDYLKAVAAVNLFK